MNLLPWLDFAAEYGLFDGDGLILCAVSGGADSMYLLSQLLEAGYPVAAAHYNHHLRENSEHDAHFVRDWCRAHGIACVVGGGDVAGQARQSGLGLEETAREMRYAFLQETARSMGASVIATAHNADDNAETLLLNLARGCGLDGLCGIPPKRGNIVRPLLTTSRAQIEAQLSEHHIPHVEDETNLDLTYSRNFLRHQVVPLLRQLNPQAVEHMTSTALRVRSDNQILYDRASQAVQTAKQSHDGWAVSVRVFDGLSRPEALRVIKMMIQKAGGQNVSEAHLVQVLRLIQSSNPSSQVDLPLLVVRRVYENALFLPRTLCTEPLPEILVFPDGLTCWGDWQIECSMEVCPQEAVRSRNEFWLDAGKLSGELRLRPRLPGDWLQPPCRPGKSLKKWFIDEKIPRSDRGRFPVLWDGTSVAAVGGLGPQSSLLASPGNAAFHIILSNPNHQKGESFMHPDVQEILLTEEQLKTRVKELGAEISRDYAGKDPLLICILRGSYIFMADLTRALDMIVEVDFMCLSSYGKSSSTSGQVQITKDLSSHVEGRDLLIIEDILDSGTTLSYLMEVLQARDPASIKLCVLLDKPERRMKPIAADYVGFTVPDAFAVGYGLDYADRYRNLPYIGILKPEIYS